MSVFREGSRVRLPLLEKREKWGTPVFVLPTSGPRTLAPSHSRCGPPAPEFLCGAAASPRDTAKAGNDRRQGEELHSSSMVSYRAKGINKFTFVNLAVALQQPDRKDFLLAASFSAGSPTATARLLCSAHSGVTCHPSTPCEARLKTSPPPPHPGSTKNSPLTVPESPH